MSPDGSRKKSRGVCVFVHTCVYTWSCPSDLEEPPGASLWVRVSGAAMGAAPAPHLLRGAPSGEMCCPALSTSPEGSVSPPWSRPPGCSGHRGDFQNEPTRLLLVSYPAEPGWGRGGQHLECKPTCAWWPGQGSCQARAAPRTQAGAAATAGPPAPRGKTRAFPRLPMKSLLCPCGN